MTYQKSYAIDTYPATMPAALEPYLDCLEGEVQSLRTQFPTMTHREAMIQAVDSGICSAPSGWTVARDESGVPIVEASGQNTNGGWHDGQGAALKVEETNGSSESETHLVLTVPPVAEFAKLCVCNTADEPADGVILWFNPGRSQILSVVFDRPNLPAMTLLRRQFTTVRRGSDYLIAFGGSVGPGASVCVEVEFFGDGPYLRQATFLTRNGPCPVARSPFEPPTEVGIAHIAELAPFRVTFLDLLRQRMKQIQLSKAMDSKATTAAKRFFAELDLLAHPGVPAPIRDAERQVLTPNVTSEELASLTELGEYLWLRVRYRAEQQVIGNTIATDAAKRGQQDRVNAAAKLMHALLTRNFSDDRDAMRTAFERFACGDLYVFGAQGAPNGVNVFAFAELALACRELLRAGGDRTQWLTLIAGLLPVFARMSELYARSYHLPGAPHRIEYYTINDNPVGARAFDETERAAVAASWPGDATYIEFTDDVGDVLARYSTTIAAALGDQFDAGPGSPAALVDHLPELAGRTLSCANHPPPRSACDPRGEPEWPESSEPIA